MNKMNRMAEPKKSLRPAFSNPVDPVYPVKCLEPDGSCY
jgi:hypothetical protein